jgi:hypothetical protein
MAGAPVGNTNSADGQRYRKAMERALAHRKGSVDDGLFAVAVARIDKALDGDADACREVGDRFDGKPKQAVEHQGADGPIEMVIRWQQSK